MKEDYGRGVLRYACLLLAGSLLVPLLAEAEEPGVTATEIRLGTVLDLEGRSKGLGQDMLKGMQAALKGKKVGKRELVLISANDSYTPEKTVTATQALLADNVLLFAGNVGTPTANVSLPLLALEKIPAVGFFTGADLLRPGEGDIINFRASYIQEVAVVVQEALKNEIEPSGICAYVQNDAYGMAGISGMSAALKDQPGMEQTLSLLDDIVAMTGDEPERNGIGPAGVYKRNTFIARDGYDSLKAWEAKQGKPCRLIVTVGAYESVGRFIAYAQSKGEPWIYSAVSFTGAGNFLKTLKAFNVKDKVVMTQVVPPLDSDLPIVVDARAALGEDLGYVTMEGYIVGRLLLYGFEALERDKKMITRENLLNTWRWNQFDLGGLKLDFNDDNQGSDFVGLTALVDEQWRPMSGSTWRGWYQ